MPNIDKPQITHYQGDGCNEEHGREPNKKEQEWEKEFDEIFDIEKLETEDESAKIDSFLYDEIKSFIRQLLQSERAKTLEEVEKMLPKEKEIDNHSQGFDCPVDEHCDKCEEIACAESHNKVLSEITELIKSKLK